MNPPSQGTDSRATQRRKGKGMPRSKRFRHNQKIDTDLINEKGIIHMSDDLVSRLETTYQPVYTMLVYNYYLLINWAN